MAFNYNLGNDTLNHFTSTNSLYFEKTLYRMDPFLFALICSLGIYPICFVYSITKWKDFLSYLRKLSLSIDITGNIVGGALLNDNFIIASSTNQFGVIRETISDNLGENERDDTLSDFGKRFTNLLGVIDFDHAKKSIIED